MKSLEFWQHLQTGLLALGRTTYYIDPKLNEEEKETQLAELTEKDPEIERLRGITDEKCNLNFFYILAPYQKEGEQEEE
jgi:hypothetical protein